jgi:hypothetical protein
MNADGSNRHSLLSHPDDSQGQTLYGPASWSPDGGKLAFTMRDGKEQLYTMNADGSGVTNISNNTYNDLQPVWGMIAEACYSSSKPLSANQVGVAAAPCIVPTATPTNPAHPLVVSVDSLNDSQFGNAYDCDRGHRPGTCMLRDAVAFVHSNSAYDYINFKSGATGHYYADGPDHHRRPGHD